MRWDAKVYWAAAKCALARSRLVTLIGATYTFSYLGVLATAEMP
ncbi:MAG: hypothetical protein AAF227_08800 [Pseudomonadota bacterium]